MFCFGWISLCGARNAASHRSSEFYGGIRSAILCRITAFDALRLGVTVYSVFCVGTSGIPQGLVEC